MKSPVYFTCFRSKKKAQEKYFRLTRKIELNYDDGSTKAVLSPRNIGHGEGYSKGSSALHAIVLIKDGKFKVKEHTKGKTHTFSLVARNGEVIFQSNRYKDRSLMDEDIGYVMECQNADIFYE